MPLQEWFHNQLQAEERSENPKAHAMTGIVSHWRRNVHQNSPQLLGSFEIGQGMPGPLLEGGSRPRLVAMGQAYEDRAAAHYLQAMPQQRQGGFRLGPDGQ